METAPFNDADSVRSWLVVAGKTFILATRDAGYRSTSAAVAELIDNSLQARASHVRVYIVAGAEAVGHPLRIAVLDDGEGMDPATLRQSLQFGGSERFNDRTGLGRFGMGLPNSSLSQSRRVEVYSWKEPGAVFLTCLDVDEITKGTTSVVPAPVNAPLPEWLPAPAPAFSGTLVVWSACDRVGYRRVGALASRLRLELGRIYRYSLWEGVRISVNDARVEPVDPLFCRGSTAPGASLVGNTLSYEVRTPASHRATSILNVQFSILPVAAWAPLSNDEKRRLGITGRGGVSIVRAGREIDYGWHLMGAKRRENYDDWWRCEVRFEPALDEYFRVTHTKQGVSPHPTLVKIVAPDLERIARDLNARVRDEFRVLTSEPTLEKTREQTGEIGIPGSRAFHLSAATTATRYERVLPPLCRSISEYRVEAISMTTSRFFELKREGERATLLLNKNHPFYEKAYLPACAIGPAEKFRIECLLLSAVRAEFDSQLNHCDFSRYAEVWSDALAAFLTASQR